eukprot:4793305-Prymnesium_polylepis.2
MGGASSYPGDSLAAATDHPGVNQFLVWALHITCAGTHPSAAEEVLEAAEERIKAQAGTGKRRATKSPLRGRAQSQDLVNPPRYLPSALPQHEQIGVHESAEVTQRSRMIRVASNQGCEPCSIRATHRVHADRQGLGVNVHAPFTRT